MSNDFIKNHLAKTAKHLKANAHVNLERAGRFIDEATKHQQAAKEEHAQAEQIEAFLKTLEAQL